MNKLRAQWIAVFLVLSMAILTLAAAIVKFEPFEREELVRVPHEPLYEKVITPEVEPKRPDYDVPLDEYTKETLWQACCEWCVPYALALAVCCRETNYTDRITVVEDRTYYGMMAVQLESAGTYMEMCDVEYLNSMEDRLRVGCCILSQHIKNEGSLEDALRRYSSSSGDWYVEGVLSEMTKLKNEFVNNNQ